MRLFAALILSVAASVASAQSNDAARVDRLTHLVVEMMPIGEIFDSLAGMDPNWPVQHKPSAVDKGELACLRDELSQEGQRRAKRREVVRYAAENPGQVAADLAVLERGAAKAFGMLVREGARAEREGVAADEAAVLAQLTPAETEAMLALLSEGQYAPLRALAGIGDALDTGKSAEQNEQAGRDLGVDLATRLMFKALDDCDIERSRLSP